MQDSKEKQKQKLGMWITTERPQDTCTTLPTEPPMSSTQCERNRLSFLFNFCFVIIGQSGDPGRLAYGVLDVIPHQSHLCNVIIEVNESIYWVIH